MSQLNRSFDSLRRQDVGEWEWLVVGADRDGWKPPAASPKVRLVAQPGLLPGREPAMALGASVALGDIVVELASGATLAPAALETVTKAFENDSVGVVFGGSGLEPLPHHLAHPAVIKAGMLSYRIDAYRDAGGYDLALGAMSPVDLICRIVQEWDVRPDGPAIWDPPPADDEIDWPGARVAYERHIEVTALAWARRLGLATIDLAAPSGKPTPDGYGRCLGTADIPDSTVGVIRAVDVLAWADEPRSQLTELHRVLAPGGMLLTRTVATSPFGDGALWDDEAWHRLVTSGVNRFQIGRLANVFPTEWHRERSIPYVWADLIALKDGGPQIAGPIR